MAKINYKLVNPILLLLILPLVLGQSTTSPNNTPSVENTTVSPAVPEETYDYLVKLVFGLEAEKVPEFIIKSIYENSNNATPADIIALYAIENVNLSQTVQILEELQINPSSLLTVDGLEKVLNELGLSFKNFYDTIFLSKLKVSGIQLRDFLRTLGINTNEFSDAMTFGDGDPLDIFKKGNFSEANVDVALKGIGKTQDELFDACREEIFLTAVLKTTEDMLAIFKKYNFGQKQALQVWTFLELSVENVENVTVFSELLDDLKFTLDNTTYLGILTNNTVGINKEVYKNIRGKMELSKLYAQSLSDNNVTVELKEGKSKYENIVTFNLENDNFTNFAEVSTTTNDLQNCVFVTLENDTIISQAVEKASNKKWHLEVGLDVLNITDLIQGSPLVCNKKVYGLAEEIEGEKVVFDTFALRSGAMLTKLINPYMIILCIVVYLKV